MNEKQMARLDAEAREQRAASELAPSELQAQSARCSVAPGSALRSQIVELRAALGNLVDAVNIEFPGGMRDIRGKTGRALIQAVNVLAEKPDVLAIIEAQKHAHETPLQLD